MSVSRMWIPKSERGREVARLLKNAGYQDATYDRVLGRYVCNLFCAGEIRINPELMRKIAYAIDSETAYAMDGDVNQLCEDILSDYDGSACSEKQAFDEAFSRIFN